jgi:hypothetical protein
MLTNTQKELIRAEEIYRQEIRRELEKQESAPSKAARVFSFLNCGVGLFLLSTVFVSFFSWGYGEIAGAREKKAKAAETAQKLRLEIVNRLDTVQKLERRFRSEHYSVLRSAIFGFQPGANVNPSWKRFYSPMFPEYRERNFASLLWQLENLSSGEKRVRIADLRRRALEFEDYFDKLIYSEEPVKGSAPLEYYSLPPEDQKKFHDEVLASFAVLRTSLE